MFRSSASVKSLVIVSLAFVMLATGCGGGGFSVSVGPNPGGGNPPPASPIPAITMDALVTITGAVLDAAPGTFGPGAQVIMRDNNGVEAHGVAAQNGSFLFNSFPGGFNTAVGSAIEVSQIVNGQGESAPRVVPILALLGP